MIDGFLVFAGVDYYPQGGWDDFVGCFDTMTEAQVGLEAALARPQRIEEWGHVVGPSGQIVLRATVSRHGVVRVERES